MNNGRGLPDESILAAVLGGDAEAYGVLVERYRARLLGLAFHLCGDYETARDLAQDTFITADECLDRIRDRRSFGSWLSGILRNKSRNLVRNNPAPTLSLDQMMEAGFDPPQPDNGPSLSDDDRRVLAECVEALPAKSREVLLLRYVEDLPYKDIAAFLAIPVTTVTMRLRYARKALLENAKTGGLL